MSIARHFSLVCTLVWSVCILSCCNSSTPTTPDTGNSNVSFVGVTPLIVSELRPDSVTTFLYFSFDTETTIAPSRAGTDEWDIRLPYLTAQSRAVDIVLNSGTVNPNGKTRGIMLDSTFDLVTVAPPDTQLRTDDTTAANRIVSIDLFGKGMFNYNGAQRTILPNPQKTLLLKTRTGTNVKVQFVNLYQGAAAMPTMFTPLGYYRLRYAKAK
jgi:hypothetical protein